MRKKDSTSKLEIPVPSNQLGIRDMEKANQAVVSHLSWRVLTQEINLASRILKAKLILPPLSKPSFFANLHDLSHLNHTNIAQIPKTHNPTLPIISDPLVSATSHTRSSQKSLLRDSNHSSLKSSPQCKLPLSLKDKSLII